jgi:glyoxylase-like metal-dependent hydrolase (beta-lactamase superfamily II)
MTNDTPQTISFEVEFSYLFDGDQSFTDRVESFETFEGMNDRIRSERRRRKKSDRPVSVRYRNLLTRHGREVYKGRRDEVGITLDEWLKW